MTCTEGILRGFMPAPKGNNNAGKGAEWRNALKRALSRASNKNVSKGLDAIADVVVRDALAGNKDAWQEIANRMDGKHAQAVTLLGDEDKPIIHEIALIPVYPSDDE